MTLARLPEFMVPYFFDAVGPDIVRFGADGLFVFIGLEIGLTAGVGLVVVGFLLLSGLSSLCGFLLSSLSGRLGFLWSSCFLSYLCLRS